MSEVDPRIIEAIDDLLLNSNDAELLEGFRWIDRESQKRGKTFYEFALDVLRNHMAERKAKEWYANRV